MLFNSYSFMLFFPLVLLVYFVIPKKTRQVWLLIASYFFYMCWNVKYIILIFASTLITWTSSFLMNNKPKKYKKIILIFAVISNLSILCFFKYFNWFLANINIVLGHIGLRVIDNPFDLVLPVGISFYTFQAMSYMIDVYRGEVEPESNFVRYALFVSFFPQLVAGPIERSGHLLPQIQHLDNVKLWNYERITSGAGLMLWGYFMKMVVADRLAILVDNVWSNYRRYGSTALILAAVFFSIQIYCDFNSYSTIAQGAARIMGVELSKNFETPYFARSIQEFWRRWHISLSIWFRDYVYIPLGGNRCSHIRKNLNLMITFLLSGLWHGADWKYIAWGGLNGLYQIIGEHKKAINWFNTKLHTQTECISYKLGQMLVTFSLTTLAWIFFRSDSVKDGFVYLYRMLTRWDPWSLSQHAYYTWGLNQTEFTIAVLSVIVLFLFDIIQYKKKMDIVQFLDTQILVARWGVYLFLFIFIFIYGIYGPEVDAAQFLYFQF